MKYIVLAIGLLVSINGFAENESSIPEAGGQKSASIKIKSPIRQCEDGCNRRCHGSDNVQSINYSASSSNSETVATNTAGTPSDTSSAHHSCLCTCL